MGEQLVNKFEESNFGEISSVVPGCRVFLFFPFPTMDPACAIAIEQTSYEWRSDLNCKYLAANTRYKLTKFGALKIGTNQRKSGVKSQSPKKKNLFRNSH